MMASGKSLKQEITDLRRHNAQREGQYIPQISFRRTITKKPVIISLKRVGIRPQDITELATHVIRHAKAVFALLILVDRLDLTKLWFESGILQDRRLPFRKQDLENVEEQVVDDLLRLQWQVQAPVFSLGMIAKYLPYETVLPYVKDEKIVNGSGCFGMVYKVELDHENQELGKRFPKTFVRKELDDQVHANELEILSILNHLRHPSIVSLLGAYKYRHKTNLLFEYADGGDLHRVFESQVEKTQFQNNENLLLAVARLSSAIECVHDYTNRKLNLRLKGFHHDLRPRNILALQSRLLLADFGLSRLQLSDKVDRITCSALAPDDYAAPECEDITCGFQQGTFSRASDVWSFGCILSELMVYIASGPSGVKDYQQSRKFSLNNYILRCFHCGSEPNPGVIETLKQLRLSGSCCHEPAMSLVHQMLSLEEHDRPAANTVTAVIRCWVIAYISKSINDYFQERVPNETEGVFLQRLRFEAWLFSMRLEDHAMWDSMAQYQKTQIFEAIVDELRALRKDLIPTQTLSGDTSTILKLQRHNDSLMNFLSASQRERFTTKLGSAVMQSRFAEYIGTHSTKAAELGVDGGILMLASLKRMIELIDSQPLHRYGCQLSISDFRDSEPWGQHSQGKMLTEQGKLDVLVDWRRYGHRGDSSACKELFIRVQCLVTFLQADHTCNHGQSGVLRCLGFFHDPTNTRFGVVQCLPKENSKPGTLRSLLLETWKNHLKWPPLEVKFRLAAALARRVLRLHLVGWLHKDIGSANILIANPKQPIAESLMEHYLIGFSHTRLDETTAFTSGISESRESFYQHPIYRRCGIGYIQEYDLYSLGILLLEIGWWRPLEKIVSEDDKQAEDVTKVIVNKRVPLLSSLMGSYFQEAVRTCLEGDFGLDEAGVSGVERSRLLCQNVQTRVLDNIQMRAI